ncbi:MAG TPA: hypothetical protein VF832_12140 [Longimicrobiales bacterium]
MPEPQTQETSFEASQAETAASRRTFRGRVLAWLGLAMWLAGVLGAYGAMGRPQGGTDGVAEATSAMTTAYVCLAGAGIAGLVLAVVAVRQARRDRLAWAVLLVNLVTGGGALVLLFLRP